MSWEDEPNALADACSSAGCRLVRRVPTDGANDPPVWVVECPTRWATVDLLDELAQRDSEDPELLALALRVVAADGRFGLSLNLRSRVPLILMLDWAQKHVRFVPELIETFKGWRETVQHGGDCDDSARVIVAMLRALGYSARLATIGDPPTHVSAQVLSPAGNGGWLWMEATVPGARLGEDPIAACVRLGLPIRADLAG